MFNQERVLMNIDDLAKYLKITRRTIYGWLKTNKIPAIKLVGQWRFRKDKIDGWIEHMQRLSIFIIFISSILLLVRPAFGQSQAAAYLCELGIVFYERGSHEDALLEFKKVLMFEPRNKIALEYINLIFEREMPLLKPPVKVRPIPKPPKIKSKVEPLAKKEVVRKLPVETKRLTREQAIKTTLINTFRLRRGIVLWKKGTVLVKKHATGNLVPLRLGMSILEGDSVFVTGKSFADISFTYRTKDLLSLRLKEDTELHLLGLNLEPEKERIIFGVPQGDMLILKNRLTKDANFRVFSPTGEIDVRGKGFELL